MKRASYREAVAWIANNDDPGDDNARRVATVSGYLSTCLVADLFAVTPERVAADVVRYRTRNHGA